jgi:hypothetical protein
MNSRNMPRNITIVIITIIVISYIIFNFRIFIAGPQIIFKSPTNGSVAEKNLIEIQGIAKNISQISMNDRQIFVNQSGEFKETVLLYPGHNVFIVRARDKFDRIEENKLEIVYNGEEVKPNLEFIESSFEDNTQTDETEENSESGTNDDLETEIDIETELEVELLDD